MDLFKKKPSIHFCHLYDISAQTLVGFMFGFMVFKATFSNISAIAWSSVYCCLKQEYREKTSANY